MLARAKQRRRDREGFGALQRLDRRARRDPAVQRDFDRVVGRRPASPAGSASPSPTDRASGSFRTSSARARLGRRRMKPRSSSAEIRRCTPDFDLRSSASRISSKLGADAALLQAIVDEEQQFMLLGGEHRPSLPERTNGELLGNKIRDVKPGGQPPAAGQQPGPESLDRAVVALRPSMSRFRSATNCCGIILRRRLSELALDLADQARAGESRCRA